ncbi:MAG TPA: hypothetical protein VGB18_08095 [Candidatus Thermoplasmatota archaeon]
MAVRSQAAPAVLSSFFVVLMAFPIGLAAQHSVGAGGEVRIEDARDDVEYSQSNVALGPVADAHPHVDVLHAWISNETVTEFEVGYQLQTWPDPFDTDGATSRFVQAVFVFGNVSYVISHGPGLDGHRCPPGTAAFGPGYGNSFTPDDECLHVEVEPELAIARVSVPKNVLHSASFLEPQVGDVLTGFFVVARQLTGFGYALDRAPDDGSAEDFRFRRGASERGGDLFLRADVPVRASNGESTTMVFNVQLGNEGDVDRVITLTAVEDNPGWAVRLPERMHVPADSSVRVPVILSMEFAHEHATTEFFRVRAQSIDDARQWAEIELGVSWLDVPQPAGHHDRLWIHSYARDGQVRGVPVDEALGLVAAWMNAVPDDPDPRVTGEPVPGRTGSTEQGPLATPVPTETWWRFRLDPGLQIGLDPDISRPGSFVTEILSTAPATSAEISVEVVYCDPTGTIPGEATDECGKSGEPGSLVRLLTGESGPRTLAANGPTGFAVELVPNATADLIPHQVGSFLELRVTLVTNTPQGVDLGQPPTPKLNPTESLLTIPLHEYHDPVDQTFLNVGTVSLEALDPYDKRVNAGRGSVFRFDVTNSGEAAHTMSLLAEGINSAWARVHEGSEITVPAHETKQVSLIVNAPDDAVAGERAELFLVAQSQEDPNVVALGRVRVTVIEMDVLDIPDEAASLSPATTDGSTPGFGTALLLLALVVPFLVRRRRG